MVQSNRHAVQQKKLSVMYYTNFASAKEYWSGTVHRVMISSLRPGSSYSYQVAICEYNSSAQTIWSNAFEFRVPDEAYDVFKIVFLADIGDTTKRNL